MTFEIQINRRWTKVSYGIFRSWSGKRRIDGAPYYGPVFTYGSMLPNPWTNEDAEKRIEKEVRL